MKSYKLWSNYSYVATIQADSVEHAKNIAVKIIKDIDLTVVADIFLREEGSYIKHYREKYGVSKKGAITWTRWKLIDER